MRTFTIRQLSDEFDVTPRTIRFYEAEGLLTPERQGQNRIYHDSDRVKLKLILRGKRLGFSLSESKELIQLYDPQTGNARQLQTLLEKISERRQMLEQQIADIKVMKNELDAAEERCMAALKLTVEQ